MSRATVAACALLCALAASDAAARCTARDSWRGPDKVEHAIAGAAIAAGWTFQRRSAWEGFAAGIVVGVLTEAADAGGGGTCSLQDAAVTAAGAALGAAGAGFALRFSERGTPMLAYVREF